MRVVFASALVLFLLTTGCNLTAGHKSGPQPTRKWKSTNIWDVARLLRVRGDSNVARKIAEADGSSLHVIKVPVEVKPHYHRFHDETVFVSSGKGTMAFKGLRDSRWRIKRIKAGSIMVIPRGTLHAFKSSGGAPTVVASVYSPAFDGDDQIFVEDENPWAVAP